MGLLPASGGSSVAILLVLGFQFAVRLLYGFVLATFLRQRDKTARTPAPKGGPLVLPPQASHAPDARKAA